MILDLLRVDETAALSFTPAAVVVFPFEVPVTLNTVPSPFVNFDGLGFFQPGEGFTLRSLKSEYPYQFGRGGVWNHCILQFFVSGGVGVVDIPELGPSSSLFLPDLCETLELGLFIKPPSMTETFQLQLRGITQGVSMLGVPSSLYGNTCHPNYQLAVEHTLPLTLT